MSTVRTCSTKFGISFRSFDCIKDLDCRHRGERSTWFHPPLPIRRRDETGKNNHSWPSPSLILYKHTIHHDDLMHGSCLCHQNRTIVHLAMRGRHGGLSWTSQSNRDPLRRHRSPKKRLRRRSRSKEDVTRDTLDVTNWNDGLRAKGQTSQLTGMS